MGELVLALLGCAVEIAKIIVKDGGKIDVDEEE